MSVFLLKIIAIICMVCDHIRYISPNLNTEITKVLGRIAFPIFAFFISEGCIYTHDIKKYLKRLGIFAILSQIPFMVFCLGCNVCDFKDIGLNVIFTMLIGALTILSFSKIENKFLKLVIIISLLLISKIFKMDYGEYGVLVILQFYIFRDTKFLKYIFSSLILSFNILVNINFKLEYVSYCIPFFIGYALSTIILKFYNNKLGKYKLKYFFYLFYPIHMLIVFGLYKFINT